MLCPVVGWAKKECPVSMYCVVYRVRPCMRLLWILCNAVSMYCRMQCTVCVLWILGSPCPCTVEHPRGFLCCVYVFRGHAHLR